MKKNKTVAFALATALLVGGTFMGTKAWFTDTKEVKNNLVLTMGTLDLAVSEGDWLLTKQNPAESIQPLKGTDVEKNTTYNNIRPGDVLTKTISIDNVGSLDQKLSVTNKLGEHMLELFDYRVTGLENLNGSTFKPTDPAKAITITLKAKTDKLTSEAGHEGQTFDLAQLNGKLTITANQINK